MECMKCFSHTSYLNSHKKLTEGKNHTNAWNVERASVAARALIHIKKLIQGRNHKPFVSRNHFASHERRDQGLKKCKLL